MDNELQPIRDKIKSYESKIRNLILDRISLGVEVAEIKMKYLKRDYTRNQNNLMDFITNSNVEDTILKRVYHDTITDTNNEIFAKTLQNIYKDYIIPETKNKQIEYINKKLNNH